MRVLVIEDEAAIRDDITRALRAAGLVVETSPDGEDGLFRATSESFAAIVLDLGLPKMDGLAVLKALRRQRAETPVLILSARGGWMERVAGIDAGADDYLPKPFRMEEVLARVEAIVRRANGRATPILRVGALTLDTRRLTASFDGAPLTLTALEFRALRFLAEHAGRVVRQSELFENLYESDREPDSNAIEVLIGRLRKKLDPEFIKTRRGLGYFVES